MKNGYDKHEVFFIRFCWHNKRSKLEYVPDLRGQEKKNLAKYNANAMTLNGDSVQICRDASNLLFFHLGWSMPIKKGGGYIFSPAVER